jgi:hypothetical protein
MNFTLFIDESGDFESSRGEWLISGVLFEGEKSLVDQKLTQKLKDLPKQFDLSSIKDFHLTEFRQNFGHTQALNLASDFIQAIKKTGLSFRCAVVFNSAKHNLSDREKTYRAMLSDMLAMIDNILPPDQEMSSLDLVVATRTISGKLQTTLKDINTDIINRLPTSLEYDLASLGLTNLIGKNLKVKQDYANNLWGLVFADFIANLSYHKKRQRENEILFELERASQYFSFEAFGNHSERRARVAERNQDFVTSTFLWLLIRQSSKTNAKSNQEETLGVIRRLYLNSGSTGFSISIESILEKIWRHFSRRYDYQTSISVMEDLGSLLNLFGKTVSHDLMSPILFRIRNFMILIMNHIADTNSAATLISIQRETLSSVGLNPEKLSLPFDFYLIELEYYVNLMDFKKASQKSVSYKKLINSYKDVWELFNEDEDSHAFYHSTFWIKSEMANLRIEILSASKGELELSLIQNRYEELKFFISHPLDLSRLKNFYLLFLLRNNHFHVAIELIGDPLEVISNKRVSPFDLFWLLNTYNAARLSSFEIDTSFFTSLTEILKEDKYQQKGHPIDLLWREVALFHWLDGNKSDALKALRRSTNSLTLCESPIKAFLEGINQTYQDIFSGKFKSGWHHFPLGMISSEPCKNELECMKFLKTISPY